MQVFWRALYLSHLSSDRSKDAWGAQVVVRCFSISLHLLRTTNGIQSRVKALVVDISRFAGGKKNALDNLCGPPGLVAVGRCEQLHIGRIHPSSAGARTGGPGYPTHHRAKSRAIASNARCERILSGVKARTECAPS